MGGAAEQLNNLFLKGSQVEISSDEEGFKGAWYVATVLESPSTSNRSGSKQKKKSHNHNNDKNKVVVYVEYHSLLAEEDGSEPLREHANVAFVRPSPPPDTDVSRNLELNDVVDAFYRDGWWTGVITRVVDSSRFVVTFQNPPDEIEFGISELRIHREWVDGKWVRPEKQRSAGLMFSAGKKVEVSFEKEDYHDVWFPAVVLENSGNGSFLVEYQRPSIGDEAGLDKVIVDFLHIRPSPPHLRDKNFVLLEKVDAFYDFGWWSGVITKELADSRYVVFFKHTNKERELNQSEIRPHMEWKDGKWFSATQDVLVPSDYQGHIEHACNIVNGSETVVSHGDSVAMKGGSEERTLGVLNSMENQIEQTIPGIEKQSFVVTSLKKKTKQTDLDNNDTHSQPSRNLKEGNIADATSQLDISPSVAPSKETVIGFTSPTTVNTGNYSSEEPMFSDQPSSKTDGISRVKKLRSKRGKGCELNNQTLDSVRKKGILANAVIKSPQASADCCIGNSAEKSAEDFVEKKCVIEEVDIPIVIGLESNVMRRSRGKKLHQLPSEKSLKRTRGQKSGASLTQLIKVGTVLGGGGESIQKRRRGRPPKILPKSPDASTAVDQQNGDAAADEMVVEDLIKNEVGSPTVAGTESMRKECSVPDKENLKVIVNDTKLLSGHPQLENTLSSMMKMPLSKKEKLTIEQPKKQSSSVRGRRGRRRTISVNTESLIQDSQDVSGGKVDEYLEKDCTAEKGEMAVDISHNTMSDDQPLSMWFEGMHSPTTVDCSSVSLGRTMEQCTKASEGQKEIIMQFPPLDTNGDIIPADAIQSLPFVKNTPLWETIESMEVFRMIPQKPHFRSLYSYKESSREGLAIGSMVTFSSVVKKTSGLQFDDPRSTIEDCLETLLELERHGFDIRVVRDRLTGLLLIKDKQEELQDQTKGLESRNVEHNHEKCKINEEIDEIDKQIRELKEKRALAMSMKEIKDSEIADLGSTMDAINEGIKSARLEFQGFAAAPW